MFCELWRFVERKLTDRAHDSIPCLSFTFRSKFTHKYGKPVGQKPLVPDCGHVRGHRHDEGDLLQLRRNARQSTQRRPLSVTSRHGHWLDSASLPVVPFRLRTPLM
jgi:hypothetical protein